MNLQELGKELRLRVEDEAAIATLAKITDRQELPEDGIFAARAIEREAIFRIGQAIAASVMAETRRRAARLQSSFPGCGTEEDEVV